MSSSSTRQGDSTMTAADPRSGAWERCSSTRVRPTSSRPPSGRTCTGRFPKRKSWTASRTGPRFSACWMARKRFKETLAKIKEMDEGISIVISGVIDRVREVLAELGLDPHTDQPLPGNPRPDGPAPAGGHPPVHHHVRPRHGFAPADPGLDPQGQDGEAGPLGGKPARRRPLHLRDFQPLQVCRDAKRSCAPLYAESAIKGFRTASFTGILLGR